MKIAITTVDGDFFYVEPDSMGDWNRQVRAISREGAYDHSGQNYTFYPAHRIAKIEVLDAEA